MAGLEDFYDPTCGAEYQNIIPEKKEPVETKPDSTRKVSRKRKKSARPADTRHGFGAHRRRFAARQRQRQR
jgi:hypothetical protein